MPVPWLTIVDGLLSAKDLVQRVRGRAPAHEEQLAAGGRLEARLAGVVVSALKEAFDRDSDRLELERRRIEEERERAERAMRLELLRQAGEREIGRLRLLAGVAVASWLGTLIFATRLTGGGVGPKVALGLGWAFLLGALAAAFSAQSSVGQMLERSDDRAAAGTAAGTAAPWLIVAGLCTIAIAALLA